MTVSTIDEHPDIAYYDAYWKRRPEASIRERHRFIADRIEPGSSILELGCGDGIFLEHLKKNKQVREEGIDLSSYAVNKAKLKGINAHVADATQLNLAGKNFDYIVAIEFIEHIAHPETVLERCKGHFRKNLFITIPNTGFWKYRAQLLGGHFPKQCLYHPSEHLRYWTMSDFKSWTGELGYKIDHIHSSKGTGTLQHLLPSLFSQSLVYTLSERTAEKT